MLQILDVWGEGRVVQHVSGTPLITGFVAAYNLNKAGQRISNGAFAGQTIPNLILVYEYDAPDFPIDDHSVPHVTLMGAPITLHVAEEMCRVVARPGKIYLYDPNETDRRLFESVAFSQGLYPEGRFLPEQLEPPFNEITLLAAYVYRAPTHPLTRPKISL
ncbi:hypothetical protein [Pantoea sp. Cy-639]|uniref:hypothetical protein n=1 Tax=Pantoea sp. Cy-639 TaxID=2608360 RepID=UPI001423F04A|nr:hypothetical protein [Pantoea sp. Cy-639]NIF17071.1 hypothetical protein [Pantoea sp. Cy-639]